MMLLTQKLKKSENIITVPLTKNSVFAYHTLYKNPIVAEKATIDFLNLFIKGEIPHYIDHKYDIPDFEKWIEYFVGKKYLIEESADERGELNRISEKLVGHIYKERQFPAIGFTTGTGCNFDCIYCMSNKLHEISSSSSGYSNPFSYSTSQKVIDDYLSGCIKEGVSDTFIGFSGGEPLVHWEKIKQLIEYIKLNYSNEIEVKFHFNSNCSLIDDKIAAFMVQNNSVVSFSLDGYDAAFNDSVRVYKRGNDSTFKAIMRGCSILKKHGMVLNGFYLTLVKENFNFSIPKLIRFAKDNNFKNVTVEPDLLGGEILIKDLVEKLIKLEQACLNAGLNLIGFWKRPYEKLVKNIAFPHSAAFCQTLVGGIIAITNDGYLKLCAYTDEVLGKANEITEIRQSHKYLNNIKQNCIGQIPACQGCEIESLCMGGCYLTREYSRKVRLKDPFEKRCTLYKEATKELIKLHHIND